MQLSSKNLLRTWWREKFVTLMVIPERTRTVHRIIVPFFLLRLGAILFSLSVVFLIVMSLDYIHVLGSMAENKRLKGENFKLRQEIQLIRNKVSSMESTMERVRSYAKKLQILTGQGEGGEREIPREPIEEGLDRSPAGAKGRRDSSLTSPWSAGEQLMKNENLSLDGRLESLQTVSFSAERTLSTLQAYLLNRTAIAAATPSLLPIAGWVSSGFGYRRHPYDGSYRFHAGVDLVAEPGTPVRSPADGVVIYSGYREGYGKVIVIDHGYGIRTLFAHASKLFVNTGIRVSRGETISQVGSTGQSTGPHLHYEIRKNGVPVNPMTFLSRSRF